MKTQIKFCIAKRLYVLLFMAVYLDIYATESDLNRWLITPSSQESLGATLGAARKNYPDAQVTIERGHPGILWRKKWTDEVGWYFVFRQNNLELFRSNCGCTPKPDGDWSHPGIPNTFLTKEDLRLNPIVLDPRFHTATGVRVGSTVGQLRKAYPEFSARLRAYLTGPGILDPQEREYVCFQSKFPNPEIGTVETMVFHVKPAKNKTRAGKYRFVDSPDEDSGSKNIDPNAMIVAIQIDTRCRGDIN